MCPNLNQAILKRFEKMSDWWKRKEYIAARKAFVIAKPICERCGRPATTPLHKSDDYTLGYDHYLKVVVDQTAESGCNSCNRNERRGRRPCPECVKTYHSDPIPANVQIHYIPFDEERCLYCEPDFDLEKIKFNKEQRNRDKNASDRKRYRQFHPKKVVKNGEWTTI